MVLHQIYALQGKHVENTWPIFITPTQQLGVTPKSFFHLVSEHHKFFFSWQSCMFWFLPYFVLSCFLIRFSWKNSSLWGPNQGFTSIRLIDRRFNIFLHYNSKYLLEGNPKAQELKNNNKKALTSFLVRQFWKYFISKTPGRKFPKAWLFHHGKNCFQPESFCHTKTISLCLTAKM